jgi:glycosyltransferase involved in cell wall biosynthesis
MSVGTPVIVSNQGSLPELVGPGGVLVNPNDSELIGQTMYDWLINPVARDRFCVMAQNQASRFTWEEGVSTLLESVCVKRLLLNN